MVEYIVNAGALAALNAMVDRVDVGTGNPQGRLRIYAGTVPADADTALTGQTLLAELNMTNPAFGNSADASPGAIATAAAISDDTAANATGTATFFRIVDRDSITVFQGAVSTAGAELNLNTTSIVTGATVSVTALTVTLPESGA